MADWTNLPNQAVGVGGLPSGTTVTALRDNPVAIAQGAAGAPRIVAGALGVNSVLQATARDAGAGAVGTWGFFATLNSGVSVAFGATIAGSSLRPAGVEYAFLGTNTFVRTSGSAPSGTWRCMGFKPFRSTIDAQNREATLFLRIS